MSLRETLRRLVEEKITVEEAENLLRVTAIDEVGDMAKLDVNREIRKGIPEIVLGEGKRIKDVATIAEKGLSRSSRIIISRLSREQIEAIRKAVPEDIVFQLNERARMLILKKKGFETPKTGGRVGIMTAGTSDIPVAEEAKIVAEEMGCETVVSYDVGVAGIHRLFSVLKNFIEKDIDTLVVIAGREGALASVVAGIVDVPIIAIPTSVGYGLGANGISALTAMLQACSLGLAVVNIDAGVAGGAIAALIANKVARAADRMP